jgi:hypothetical protein
MRPRHGRRLTSDAARIAFWVNAYNLAASAAD